MNTKPFFFTFLFLVGMAGTDLRAQAKMEADGSVLLPVQRGQVQALHLAKQAQLSRSTVWQRFSQRAGNWSVQWNEVTQTPHRAFGPALSTPGFSYIQASNVEQASLRFIEQHKKTLGIDDIRHLKLVRAQQANNRWYISYTQMANGIEVLRSEVELRMFQDGKVTALGSDFYPNITTSSVPNLSFAEAQARATFGLRFNPQTDKVAGDGTLYYLPIETQTGVSYHLVYRITVQTRRPLGNYLVFVDAHTGGIRWRLNRTRNHRHCKTSTQQALTGQATGQIQPTLSTDAFEERTFQDMYVEVAGQQFTTDSEGNFTLNLNQAGTLKAELKGPWVNVTRGDAEDRASFEVAVNDGDNVAIVWDDTNAHAAERDAFYHINIIHDFITTLDPNFTGMDYQVPAIVNINDESCNAYWDGNGLGFFVEGEGECTNLGQSAGVIYHEYGHGINDKLYKQAGAPFGSMINGAAHEGMADVAALMLQDDPRVGAGEIIGEPYIRTLENTTRYPEDATGGSHDDGTIIGGAFWDLRKATSLETMNRLAHFAKYGTPDDEDTGIAFSEWFVEVLIADDDDGDLGNKTPNYDAILNAFNAHGIGTSLFLRNSFTHAPLSNTLDLTNPYPVTFGLQGFQGSTVNMATVHYSVDGFQTVETVDAGTSTPDNFRAEMPAQAKGSIVQYYITAQDPATQETLAFPAGAPQNSFMFLVGFASKHQDAFETDTGWITGDAGDTATEHTWERADPDIVDPFGPQFIIQPDDDHSVNGTECFVTGATWNPPNTDDEDEFFASLPFPDGETSLFSPVFDLADIADPIISYFRWNLSFDEVTATDWQVSVSNDAGQTWVTAFEQESSEGEWVRNLLRVADFVTPTNQVQFRFKAGFFVNSLLDDFEILGTDGEIGIATASEAAAGVPTQFILHGNYPNPFNPETRISYTLPRAEQVVLIVYNLMGQEIRTLVNQNQPAGLQSVKWDGRNNAGVSVPSGTYLYRIKAGSSVQSRKMLLVK